MEVVRPHRTERSAVPAVLRPQRGPI